MYNVCQLSLILRNYRGIFCSKSFVLISKLPVSFSFYLMYVQRE